MIDTHSGRSGRTWTPVSQVRCDLVVVIVVVVVICDCDLWIVNCDCACDAIAIIQIRRNQDARVEINDQWCVCVCVCVLFFGGSSVGTVVSVVGSSVVGSARRGTTRYGTVRYGPSSERKKERKNEVPVLPTSNTHYVHLMTYHTYLFSKTEGWLFRSVPFLPPFFFFIFSDCCGTKTKKKK